MGTIPTFRGPTLVCTAWSIQPNGGPRFEPVADTTLAQDVEVVYEPSH